MRNLLEILEGVAFWQFEIYLMCVWWLEICLTNFIAITCISAEFSVFILKDSTGAALLDPLLSFTRTYTLNM